MCLHELLVLSLKYIQTLNHLNSHLSYCNTNFLISTFLYLYSCSLWLLGFPSLLSLKGKKKSAWFYSRFLQAFAQMAGGSSGRNFLISLYKTAPRLLLLLSPYSAEVSLIVFLYFLKCNSCIFCSFIPFLSITPH